MAPRLDSRYQFCRAFQDDDERWFLEVPYPFRFTNERDNVAYQVSAGDTLQILAYRFYRGFDLPAQLWRAIAEFNDIIDATLPLEEGKILMIPSPRWIRDVYFAPPSEYKALLAQITRVG